MNRKISVILIMIIMTVSVLCGNMFINKVYADESDAVCKLHFSVAPSNPDRGDDILIKLSSTEIKKGIASVSFTLDFNADVFSISSATAATGWTLTKTENTLFLTTSDNEATTQTGDIASVILKVSDTAPYGNTILTFKSIQAADGDANSVDFTELNQTITITQRSSGNTATNDVARNDTASNDTVSNDVVSNEISGNNTIENDIPVNRLPIEKINEIGGYNTADKNVPQNNTTKNEVTPPNMPKTGDDYAMPATILGLSILSIVTFVLYRKNRM